MAKQTYNINEWAREKAFYCRPLSALARARYFTRTRHQRPQNSPEIPREVESLHLRDEGCTGESVAAIDKPP